MADSNTASPDDAAARDAFEAGRRAYERGDFAEALAYYERSHALSRRPELLFNIGRAADSDGLAARAIESYAAYLEAFPDASNREFVNARLAKMQVLARSAAAGGEGAPSAGERQRILDEAARALFTRSYREARTLFLRAHALLPTAQSHRGIALAECELRDYPSCIEHLSAALRAREEPLDEALADDASQLLARARTFVGELLIETTPPFTEVVVDGVPVDLVPGRALVLVAGAHDIELKTSGYAPERRRVEAKGGETATLRALFGRPLTPPRSAATAPRESARRGWHKNPWLWGAVGAAVVAAGTGAGVAMSRGGARTRYDQGTWNALGTTP